MDFSEARLNRLTTRLIALAVAFVLPFYSCGLIAILVLLDIIADSEMVIEPIARFLFEY